MFDIEEKTAVDDKFLINRRNFSFVNILNPAYLGNLKSSAK